MKLTVRMEGYENALRQFADQERKVERAAIRTLNKVGAKFRTQVSRDIRERYNLSASYVNEHLTLSKADRNRQAAEIRARRRGVLLSRYGAKQRTRAAKGAKGDVRRGISAGRKQAGVSIKVLRASSRVQFKRFFLIPLKRGGEAAGGNGMGVAVRTGKGRNNYKILQSISVDQMFRHMAPSYTASIGEELKDTFATQLAYELKQ